MALDQETAQRLWNERYQEEIDRYAHKNKYLNEFGDPEDLSQDMAINVWLKAVNNFDQAKVTYSGDVDRSFNAFFTNILNQYLSNLSTHRDTGKQTYFREKQRSLDAPVKEDDEDSATLQELLEIGETSDPDVERDVRKLLSVLPDNLSNPLKYIIDNADRGNIAEILQQIRERWGWTKTRLLNELTHYPEFIDFITAY